MDKAAMKELIRFFGDYNSFLQRTVQAQNEKIEVLLTHDVALIEQSVAKQQAVGMQIANYEERRQKLMEKAGVGGCSFEQLIQKADDEDKQQLRDAYRMMQDAVSQIKFLNDKAMQLVETNLKVMNVQLPTQERMESRSYSGDGKTHFQKKGSSLFETKI